MQWIELNEDSVTAPVAASDDIDLFEMANLEPSQTGIEGTIYISTQQGGHGPRVNYYAGRPGNNQPSMSATISAQPEVAANNLPTRVRNKMEPIVKAWVALNYAKLNEFWYKGNTWYTTEVNTFIAGLKKWTPSATPPMNSPVPIPVVPPKQTPKRRR